MDTLTRKKAIVVGASSGVGRATVKRLASEGASVVAVARSAEGLDDLRAETGDAVRTFAGDASDATLADRLLRETRPDLVVLALGVHPHMAPLDAMSWEQFSAAWNVDVQAAFHWTKSALQAPLAPGSVIAIVSSGAAIAGSPLSGGYAGAKRMQWLMAGYAQRVSDARKLGIRAIAVLPTQLIEGTRIGHAAAAAYGAARGMSAEQFMRRLDPPLHVEEVAEAILQALRGDIAAGATAIGVSGKGTEALP
jgi:NAD(P)-dependent dehydrogenase (short-subunit alcohol dehydrogenase family)